MIYHFECEDCEIIEEVQESIQDGPPFLVSCPGCGEKMNQIYGCNFILKGNNWPGKDLKKREYNMTKEKEKMEAQFSEDARNQRIVEEVTEVRRQGRAAIQKLAEDKPQKLADYHDAFKKGHRAKGKSYKAKDVK